MPLYYKISETPFPIPIDLESFGFSLKNHLNFYTYSQIHWIICRAHMSSSTSSPFPELFVWRDGTWENIRAHMSEISPTELIMPHLFRWVLLVRTRQIIPSQDYLPPSIQWPTIILQILSHSLSHFNQTNHNNPMVVKKHVKPTELP